MKRTPILLALLVLLLSVSFVRATDISDCATLNTAGDTYYLTANIPNSGASTCMDITNENITLDCQGHTIDGDNMSTNYGIYVYAVANTVIHNCTILNWLTAGIGLESSINTRIYDNQIYSNNNDGIAIESPDDATIYDNMIMNNDYGISIYNGDTGSLIYNNYFNNNHDVWLDTDAPNDWNITNQTGTRIYGSGLQIGGNYWAGGYGTPENEYSRNCIDANHDGFCDQPYDAYSETNCTAGIDCGNNVDYLPLSAGYIPPTPPASTCPPMDYFAGLVVIFVFLSVALGMVATFALQTPEIAFIIAVPALMAAVWLVTRLVTCG